ncbi:hypothetical protein ACHAO8_007374 [Botrytis cinerea]
MPSLQHLFLFSSPSSKITPFFDTLQDWKNSTNKLTEYAREYQGTCPYPGKKRVQITDSGQRRVKETITIVLKAVVLGDGSIVGAATTDDDLKELGAVAGAVIHAIKKAEVSADWGWEDRYYEIVKIYEENWEDLLRLLCEFTPDIDVQAVANITDVDNSDVWGMPHNFSHRP